MTSVSSRLGLPSWIPPSFGWYISNEVFAVKVPISDPHVVEFVSTGSRMVELHRTRAKSMMMARIRGVDSLCGQLEMAAWNVLRHTDDWKRTFAMAKVHCVGLFRLPGDKELLVLVGLNLPRGAGGWLTGAARTAAHRLLEKHQNKVASFDECVAGKKDENEQLLGKQLEWERINCAMELFDPTFGCGERPVLTAEELLSYLPIAVCFKCPHSATPQRVERAAIAAIVNSGYLTSRDGCYVGLLSIPMEQDRIGVVSWVPRADLPAYPEVRWSVQGRVPQALLKPRLSRSSRPEFDLGATATEETVVMLGTEVDGADSADAFVDLQLEDTDFRRRVDEVRGELKGQGFEAIAWFQPYHSWAEETWGIYFDARKLDALALSLLEDFRTQRLVATQSDAARLAFGLTYAHELFHAKVEAALSWMEINAHQPRHLRYERQVYEVLRETAGWLEEALANWSAWQWYRSGSVQADFLRRMDSLEGLHRIVEAALDLSPPGYRDWRAGQDVGTWRKFGTELATGKPHPPAKGGGFPLEGVLRGPLAFDFQVQDIPMRFVGRGDIADRLLAHPATFNVPNRRELEKALKYFKHVLDPSGGKGGHQKWTGPDQRAFILPTRDPVSVGVFKTFLQYLGIDKSTYVREVRPNL